MGVFFVVLEAISIPEQELSKDKAEREKAVSSASHIWTSTENRKLKDAMFRKYSACFCPSSLKPLFMTVSITCNNS